MVDLVAHHLTFGTKQPAQPTSLVLNAARKVSGKMVGMEALEVPILDALAADRWKDR
jgi:hypothetical protein